jgi:hypothetical protein
MENTPGARLVANAPVTKERNDSGSLGLQRVHFVYAARFVCVDGTLFFRWRPQILSAERQRFVEVILIKKHLERMIVGFLIIAIPCSIVETIIFCIDYWNYVRYPIGLVLVCGMVYITGLLADEALSPE